MLLWKLQTFNEHKRPAKLTYTRMENRNNKSLRLVHGLKSGYCHSFLTNHIDLYLLYTTDWSTKYFQVIRQKLFGTLQGKRFQLLLGYKLLNPQIPNLSTQQFLLGGKTWPLSFHVLLTKEIAVVRLKMTIFSIFSL